MELRRFSAGGTLYTLYTLNGAWVGINSGSFSFSGNYSTADFQYDYQEKEAFHNLQQLKVVFFSMWIFSVTNIQDSQSGRRRGEAISLIPFFHFHPLHRHLDISRAITAESSPLHIASRLT